ncbi:hypothetical protein [Streptomyces sp. 11x1]|nr:hypothetical protein [Streptomyces sp. 11x1]WNZ11691.1 hypothetical protein P8T65_31830 [Streptomyces sp. 11x1]
MNHRRSRTYRNSSPSNFVEELTPWPVAVEQRVEEVDRTPRT